MAEQGWNPHPCKLTANVMQPYSLARARLWSWQERKPEGPCLTGEEDEAERFRDENTSSFFFFSQYYAINFKEAGTGNEILMETPETTGLLSQPNNKAEAFLVPVRVGGLHAIFVPPLWAPKPLAIFLTHDWAQGKTDLTSVLQSGLSECEKALRSFPTSAVIAFLSLHNHQGLYSTCGDPSSEKLLLISSSLKHYSIISAPVQPSLTIPTSQQNWCSSLLNYVCFLDMFQMLQHRILHKAMSNSSRHLVYFSSLGISNTCMICISGSP